MGVYVGDYCECETCASYAMSYAMASEPKHTCRAGEFERRVKLSHFVPQDPTTWKRLGVTTVVHTLTHGLYKTVSLDFKDGSSYEHNKIFCDCDV